jgi:tetratricopeptide (TPR) repeat protein
VAGELPALNARILFETAAALLGQLTPEERSRMQLPSGRNGRAYEIYLEAAPFLVADDPQSLRTAELLFQRSLELDSTFADAHVGLGAVYNSRYFKGIEGGDQNLQLAREHFETAARLDSTSALAMRALTNLYWQDNDGEKCLAIARRARSMRPRTLDLQLVAQEAYTLGGLSDIGADIGEEILAVDPANPAARFWQVISTAFSGQAHRVLFHGKEYIRRFGEDAETYSWMSDAAGQLGEKDKALALARRATELEENSRDPRYLWNLSVTEEEFVGPARARETRMKLRDLLEQRLSESPNQTRNRFMLMQVLGRLNERDHAMEQWRYVKAALDSTGHTLTPDIPLAVPILVRMGEADEARRVKAWLEHKGIYATDDFDSRMMLLESRDPLVLEYIADARAEGGRRRALYGRP